MLHSLSMPRFKLIYVFRIDDAPHRGCLKIGETSLGDETADIGSILSLPPNDEKLNQAAHKRIKQYTETAGILYELLHTEAAVFQKASEIKYFNDKEVHRVLEHSNIKRKEFENGGKEWFITDLDTVKKAIRAVKEGRQALGPDEISRDCEPIRFRPEQREAINKTIRRLQTGKRMLWNAKMRFGKTLCALEAVKRMRLGRTLILTHRPVVNEGWFEDFHKIFHDRHDCAYGSKSGKGSTFEDLENAYRKGKQSYVYFASMQDLRGSETVGGKFDKNDSIFSTPWELIIVDEAHEGTTTSLGKEVIDALTKRPETKVLSLSGTPFNLLGDYKDDEVYTWDYVMEQRAKKRWEETAFGDSNPYAGLPRLNILIYDLGEQFRAFTDELAFNLREFFRTDSGGFAHENDVRSFLDLLVREDEESMYPFANDRHRSIFRHTLWVVPGVKEAKALSGLLKGHSVFGEFEIVNVAGDGDEDGENDDALRRVNAAIGENPDETRTITLSCGRLTTGVSVPAWTGVLMLAGSYNTSAAAYMQTIFRVQTPATINGRVKEDCYVFDFAPDRTLQVLAAVPRVSAKAGRTTAAQRSALGEFLNFCPVIAIKGSRMEEMNVERMLRQLKRAFVERVVQKGFDDSGLYSDALLELSEDDREKFKELEAIIGRTPEMDKTGHIDINSQGLTKEEREEMERLGKKKKKERTAEEEARLKELKEKKEVRKNAISILRGISIRMPLLIYGADIRDEEKELTIDNFTALTDTQSWKEFMPRGVTKQKFDAFKKYYDPDIFSAAGKRIRDMARAADRLSAEERIGRIADIFSTFRNPDKETVLTPWRVVNMHLGDCLGGYCFFNEAYTEPIDEPRLIDRGGITDEAFAPDARLLEINSKSGLYPLLLAYNVYRRRLEKTDAPPATPEERRKIWDRTLKENIFVLCKTPMAKAITRRTLMGFRTGHTNICAPGENEDLVEMLRNQRTAFLEKARNFVGKNMKINAIVGNPPYQEEGASTRKAPIYHLFYDAAFELADKVSLITPGRFLFKAGQTPGEWMERRLEDPHFKIVKYFPKSADVFPTVDIKGGVAITLRDAQRNFGRIGFFSAYAELRGIYQKVTSHSAFVKGAFAALVSVQGLYKFTESLFADHPRVQTVQGKGTAAKITSKSLEQLPEVFLNDAPEQEDQFLKIMGLCKKRRVYRWIRKDYVAPVDSLNSYKVFVPEANGTGAIGEVLSTPIIGTPIIGHTDTFLSIGKFDTEAEAENCLTYLRTKFARTLLGTLKATQHNPRDTWGNVPLQDFTANSDIDWSQGAAGADRQLYAKYGLTEEEIDFIEKKITSM